MATKRLGRRANAGDELLEDFPLFAAGANQIPGLAFLPGDVRNWNWLELDCRFCLALKILHYSIQTEKKRD